MKICVIGGGSIGKRHLNNIKILDPNIGLFCLKRAYDKQFEIDYFCKVIIKSEEIISNNVDSIMICNPTSLHVEWIKFAHVNNLNVFIEKPLVSSLEQFAEIKELKFKKSVSFIGFMLRYHKSIIKIKNILNLNYLGQIYSAEFAFGSFLPDWPYEDYKNSYVSLKKLGGGVVNTISHEIDLIYHLFDLPQEIISINKNFNLLDIECEEIHKSIVVYNDKLITLTLDLISKDYRREIKIFGSEGTLLWNWQENVIQIKYHNVNNSNKTYSHEKTFDVNNLYLDEVSDFIYKIKNSEIEHGLDFEYAKINSNLLSKFKNEI